MSNLLTHVWNMSMTGSIVILFVLAARLLIRKLPKIYSYALWSVVLFRLLCPVSFVAPISILEAVDPGTSQSSDSASIVSYIPDQPEYYTDYVAVPTKNTSVQSDYAGGEPAQLRMTPMHVLSLIWAVGAAAMLLYGLFQYQHLRQKLTGNIHLFENVYLVDNLDTAFVMGVFRPRIYIPSNIPERERKFILAHERHHIRRMDPLIKLLAYLALCIHWFNPLVWIAFLQAGKDMEMSCDEAVIKKLGLEIRSDYCSSLLRLSVHKKILPGMPLAFGEGDAKGRVMNIAKWKNPTKLLAAVCVILCICVVAVCAFNPEEPQSMEALTHRYSDEPVYTGIGDLFFTYPAGLSSESREVDNWTREEELRRLRHMPNRNQWDQFFMDDNGDFGGCVGFLVPADREIRLEELNLPNDWKGLDYIAGSSAYPYAEKEYTLIKDGEDYIQLYLYTYSGHGYFLWFYAQQGDPAIKEAILESVELGNGSHVKTKTTYDEPISLGLFNMTIPKGYGYSRTETIVLEITKKDVWGNHTVLGCVTAMPNPDLNLPEGNEAELIRWVESVGIDLSGDGRSSEIAEKPRYGDVSLTIRNNIGIEPIEEVHYLYIAGGIVYDLWLDPSEMDDSTITAILDSIWIKDSKAVPGANRWVTAAAHSSVQIGLLPEGYNVGYDRQKNIIFAWGSNAVGGVTEYMIPEGLYDPYDRSFFWLEEMEIPDYEDEGLVYTGGMTAGDNGWVAEFASDVPPGTPVTVHRRHTFYVMGNMLYDVWFDMMSISRDTAQELAAAVHLPQLIPVEAPTGSPEDIAYEKTLSVMDAVSEGSSHIISRYEDANSAYEEQFLYHEGNYLYMGPEEALLIVEEAWFVNQQGPGEQESITWIPGTEEPETYPSPWLGNRIWNKSFAAYLDTLTEDSGTTYMWRYDRPYADEDGYADHYFVDFHFDQAGNFRYITIHVNLFMDNAFTVTETILSTDPERVNAVIQDEYSMAVS